MQYSDIHLPLHMTALQGVSVALEEVAEPRC